MADKRAVFVGEQVTLTGTVVEARDAGNIAVRVGARIIHVSATELAEPEPAPVEAGEAQT